jgi:hypothetical protein
MLSVAFPNVLFVNPENLIGATARAFYAAIRPAKANHEALAVIKIVAVDNGFLQGLGGFHVMIMPLSV